MSAWTSLRQFLFAGATPEQLAATRWILGIGFIPFFLMQYGALFGVDPLGPAWRYIDPVWYFALLGIDWHVPVVAMAGVVALVGFLVSFAVGWQTRVSAWAILALVLLLKGARDSVAGDIHHREIIPFHILFFFALSRCGDVSSIDSQRRTPSEPVADWEASWPIRASQIYVAAFYLWSGIAKLRVSGAAWFEGGGGLQGLLLGRSVRFGFGEGDGPASNEIGLWLAQYPEALTLLALGVTAMELGFPVLLFLRALWLRLTFLAGVTFFHVANYVLMNVQFLLLPVVFVLFVDPSAAVRRFLPRASGPR